MNILLISFYEDNENMYPHLKLVLDKLRKEENTDYFTLTERGYSFGNLSFKQGRKLFKRIFKEYKKLKKVAKKTKYDKIIAIDHFAYFIASLVFPKDKIIFWSFDIIANDVEYFNNKIVRFILNKNKELINNGTKVIIQSEERLKVLEKTLSLTINRENVHLLPVFIKNIDMEFDYKLHNKLPILMQTGSFDGSRYTEELIAQFQKDDTYDLCFHGLMHTPEKIRNILDNCEKIPLFSTMTISPNKVYKIIQKCDIGFVGLSLSDDNHKYMSGASGQLLEFLRMAKPVVSMGPNNIGDFLEEHDAGIKINSIDQLPDAVRKISNNYENYSKNAKSLHDTYYDETFLLSKFMEMIRK